MSELTNSMEMAHGVMGVDASGGRAVEAGAAAGGAPTSMTPVMAAGTGATAAAKAAEGAIAVVDVGVMYEACATEVEVAGAVTTEAEGAAVSATMESFSSAPRAAGVGNPHLMCI
jgi:hypothetical protein